MNLTALRELVVLNAVRAQPAHGYALFELLESGFGDAVGLKRPTVYAILSRFDHRGWVRTQSVRDSNYPEKQVHDLTPKGAAAYQRMLVEVAGSEDGLMPFAALVALFDDLEGEPRRAALASLKTWKQAQEARLSGLPRHEGAAGVALRLMLETCRAELKALDLLHKL